VTPAVYSLGLPETVTITSAKYATYATNRALDFSDTGITAYTAAVSDDKVLLSRIEDGIVPAHTGVILYKDVAETKEEAVPFLITDKTITNNELVGTQEAVWVYETADDHYNYILQRSGDQVVFNKAKSSGAKMPAGRAYLSTTTRAASARMVAVFDDAETTDISVLTPATQPSSVYYNLKGQRVAVPQSCSLYVVNGKKVLFK
jgi:hypothetical protein